MRAKYSFVAAIIVSLGLLVSFAGGVARADVNDFVINNFTADETLTTQDPQGELHVVEHIAVTFTDNNHGILRAIPNSYKGHKLNLHVNEVTSPSQAPSDFAINMENGNKVLKIGDPNKTVTGPQEYVIDYTVQNVISFYNDHDELYFDVNGDQWQQPAEHVSVTLHVPADVALQTQPICFTGAYGQKLQNCQVTKTADGFTAVTTSALGRGETLTYVAGFSKGAFTPFSRQDSVSDYLPQVLKIVVLPLLTLLIGFYVWFKNGRDAPGRGVIVPQYDAPDGMRPAFIGSLMDFSVDNKDVTATIIDLAVRRYLKITETRQDRLIGADSVTYTLTLLNNDYAQLQPFETLLMNEFFDQGVIGEEKELAKAQNSLYKAAQTMKSLISDQMTKAGYYRSNPLSSGKMVIGAIVTLFVFMYIGPRIFGALFFVSALIALVILIAFLRVMPARTAKGVTALEHAKGLKLFLEVTQAERLKRMQSPDTAVAPSSEPERTVDLFEKLLPYAMVLGVEKQWAGQFADLYSQPPDWYSGGVNNFSALYLASSMQSFQGSVGTSFSSPSSSSGSGFGGGGFSGGGGGGGGGGGW